MIRLTLAARSAVLVFDESQHLDIACLETVRELLDLAQIGMVFMGSHELERNFLLNAVRLEQWNSRFYAGERLPGMTDQEASRAALEELGEAATPGVINKLLAHSRVPHLRQAPGRKKADTYISARRLFNMIHELKFGIEEGGAE